MHPARRSVIETVWGALSHKGNTTPTAPLYFHWRPGILRRRKKATRELSARKGLQLSLVFDFFDLLPKHLSLELPPLFFSSSQTVRQREERFQPKLLPKSPVPYSQVLHFEVLGGTVGKVNNDETFGSILLYFFSYDALISDMCE